MKPLAKRISVIKPSPTLAVTAKAKELKAQGKNVVDFGAGEPDFDTPDFIKVAAAKAMNEGKTKYTPVGGTNELKDAVIAKLRRDNNVAYTRDEIIVTNGGKHALYNIAMALLDDDDEVIIPAPYWVSYPDQVLVCGGRPVIVTTTDKTGFKMSPAQLREAITNKTKYVILNSPGNPTGAAYSRQELVALAQVAIQHDLYIVTDEIYEHIVYDNFKHFCLAAESEAIKARTLVVNGASKCYSMTGWRMGFAAGPADVIKAMTKLQGQSTSNVSSITQAACAAAFSGSLEAVKRMVAAFNERRDFIVKALNAIPGITTTNPEGAFYVFPNISALFGKKTPGGRPINSSGDFCLHLLEDHLVATVPGSAFGAEGYVRLSYATDLETIREGVARIKRAVSELKA